MKYIHISIGSRLIYPPPSTPPEKAGIPTNPIPIFLNDSFYFVHEKIYENDDRYKDLLSHIITFYPNYIPSVETVEPFVKIKYSTLTKEQKTAFSIQELYINDELITWDKVDFD